MLSHFLIIILAIITVYQDFRHREISLVLIPVYFLCFALNQIQLTGLRFFLINFSVNSGIILLLLLFTSGYFWMKERKFKIIDQYLGLGDVLLFFALAAAFSPVNFIVFLLAGFIFSIAVYLIKTIIIKRLNNTIPLAGCISILLIVVMLIPNLNRFEDLKLITTILT